LAVSQLQRVWMEGGRLTVEEILAESPQLQSSTEALVELCLTEYRARQAAGDRVRVTDYLLRFPHLRPHLQARFRDEPAAVPSRQPSARPAQQPQQQPLPAVTQYPSSPAATSGGDSYLDQSPAHTLDAPRSMPDTPRSMLDVPRSMPEAARRPVAPVAPVAPVFQTQDYRSMQYAFLQPPQESDEIGRVNDFGILRELGRGNMGIVFLAREPGKLRRQIALKIMLPSLAENEGCCRRFEREARNMARLNHERTVPVYHVDEYRDPTSGNRIPFLTMPILRGMTLKDRISQGPIPVAEVVRIARELAEGLAAAHAEGIVHRDIKPANIWLQADTQSVKILDFGLARAHDDENLTVYGAGGVVGTPAYMAPEQHNPQRDGIDQRTDLFGLGVIIYEMLTGKLPFPGRTIPEIVRELTKAAPVPLRKLNPDVPKALAELVQQLLRKEKQDRPQSANEVVRRLGAIELSLTARSSSGRKLLLPLVAVVILAGAGVGGWWLWTNNLWPITSSSNRELEPSPVPTTNDPPAAKGQQPPVADDRVLAKWANTHRGTLIIRRLQDGRPVMTEIKAAAKLPDEPFQIVGLELTPWEGISQLDFKTLLPEAKSLERLTLIGDTYGPWVLDVLMDVPSLRSLHLVSQAITDADAWRLKSLKQLDQLDISETAITERSRPTLQELRHLKRLVLNPLEFPASKRAFMQKAMPNLRIEVP
jgi:serine/threonine protein kinase